MESKIGGIVVFLGLGVIAWQNWIIAIGVFLVVFGNNIQFGND